MRVVRPFFVVGCALALLLPVLSISGEDAADDFALPAAAVVAGAALTALAVIEPQPRSLARYLLATLADPRSPPRG